MTRAVSSISFPLTGQRIADGMSLTRQLRAQPSARPLTIVAFTAYAMMGDKEKFLAVGCDGYIAKPLQVATFADEVRALLPRTP